MLTTALAVLNERDMIDLSRAIQSYSSENESGLPRNFDELTLNSAIKQFPVDEIYFLQEPIEFEGGVLIAMPLIPDAEPRNGLYGRNVIVRRVDEKIRTIWRDDETLMAAFTEAKNAILPENHFWGESVAGRMAYDPFSQSYKFIPEADEVEAESRVLETKEAPSVPLLDQDAGDSKRWLWLVLLLLIVVGLALILRKKA